MSFDRWGMSGAIAALRDPAEDGMNIMHRLCDRPDWIAPTRQTYQRLERRQGEQWLWPWFNGRFDAYALKMRSNWLSKLYADLFDAAGCPDLREHDLRHEATSRFFERTQLPAEAIMKITGHRTHKMVMRYLRLRGSSLAAHLW